MKLKNARNFQTLPSGTQLADVDVEVWGIFGYSTKTVKVCIPHDGLYWRFMDTGNYTPDNQMDKLAKMASVYEELKSIK